MKGRFSKLVPRLTNARILISRSDNIGDVILTLPVAAWLKENFPQSTILFLGKNYTRPIIEACSSVDHFVSADLFLEDTPYDQKLEAMRQIAADLIIHVFPRPILARLAKAAKIPYRIGTSHRFYHWLTCNRLVNVGRKKSHLHESLLNFQLLTPILDHLRLSAAPLKKPENYSFPSLNDLAQKEILDKVLPLNKGLQKYLDPKKINLILHPKSRGSAREWGLENFDALVHRLSPRQYKIFLTGSKEEGELCKTLLLNNPHLTDLTGKLSLQELLSFIKNSDALIAASTGPLHIAASVGIAAIGLYAPMHSIHPGRWAPLGPKARYLVLEKNCLDCRRGGPCQCIKDISPDSVEKILAGIFQKGSRSASQKAVSKKGQKGAERITKKKTFKPVSEKKPGKNN